MFYMTSFAILKRSVNELILHDFLFDCVTVWLYIKDYSLIYFVIRLLEFSLELN